MMNTPNHPARFVILCRPRTGSSLLVELLNQFSDIVCHGELFRADRVGIRKKRSKKLKFTPQKRDRFPITFIKRVYAQDPEKISGFKLFFSHNAFARQYVLESKGIKKIILSRDPLEIYLSVQRARHTGEWTRRNHGSSAALKDAPNVQIKFDKSAFEKLAKILAEREQLYSDFEAFTRQSFLRIDYKEVAKLEPVRAIAQALGSTDNQATLAPKLERQSTRPPEQMIENYEEMQKYLATSEYGQRVAK